MSASQPKYREPKYRVILRVSLDKDNTSTVRNSIVKPHLEKAGFTNNKTTGTWETASSGIGKIQAALNKLLEELAELTANPFDPRMLDHLWIYMDKVETVPNSSEQDMPRQKKKMLQ